MADRRLEVSGGPGFNDQGRLSPSREGIPKAAELVELSGHSATPRASNDVLKLAIRHRKQRPKLLMYLMQSFRIVEEGSSQGSRRFVCVVELLLECCSGDYALRTS